MSEKILEEFEAWVMSQVENGHFYGGYTEGEYDLAWSAWQASRESLVIELPPTIDAGDAAHAADCEPEYGVNIAHMVNGAIMACGAFIKAAGLKVKP